MQERYLSMISLRDSLMELYKLCGVAERSIPIRQRSAFMRWVEALFEDKAICEYLQTLTEMTDEAVVAMKDRNLDDWNNRCNEARLEQTEKMLAQADERNAQLEQQLAVKAQPEDDHRAAKDIMQAIRGIISMRDNLLMKKEWAKDCAAEDINAVKLVDSQLLETAKLLKQLNVEILEDTGAFDSRLHTVVQTLPAQSDEQIDTIAETFRPGYRFNGEVIRPQEVVVFVKA